MDVRALLGRVLEVPWVVAVRAVLDTYGNAAGGLLANGLAFAALFAAIPTTLLVLGLAGWAAAGNAELSDRVIDALVAAMPPLSDLIRRSVDLVADAAALTSLIGIIGMVWTVSQLVGALDTAFARIFSDERERDVVGRTLRGLLAVGVLAVAVIGLIAGLVVLAAIDTISGTEGSLARVVTGLLGTPPALLVVVAALVVGGYRTLPPRPPRWRALFIPAVTVGAILVVLSQVFTVLVPRLVGVAELAGPLASVFVALAWLSFSFQALLLGAAWVRVRDAGSRSDPGGEGQTDGSATLERAAPAAEPGGR
jgi:membrane protein